MIIVVYAQQNMGRLATVSDEDRPLNGSLFRPERVLIELTTGKCGDSHLGSPLFLM